MLFQILPGTTERTAMKSIATRLTILGLVLLGLAVTVIAQQVPAPPLTNDPRVGLKAGLHDAGEAAKNLEKIASLPKPEGFFDPEHPAGTAAPPERPANAAPEGGPSTGSGQAPSTGSEQAGRGNAPADPDAPPPFDPVASNRLSYTNSDLAFSGHHVIVGNYHGFNT